MGLRIVIAVGGLALTWGSLMRAAFAADQVVDDFRNSRAAMSSPRGLTQRTLGSQTVVDGVPRVLGGTRRTTIIVDRVDLGELDAISAGIDPTTGTFSYASTEGADGRLELTYDAGGKGLNANLSSGRGLSVDVADADVAAVPYTVNLSLTDRSGRSASATQSVKVPGRQQVQFLFAALRGPDVRRIQKITIRVDPARAGDLRLQQIRVLGVVAGAK